jgi:hypothetical protein
VGSRSTRHGVGPDPPLTVPVFAFFDEHVEVVVLGAAEATTFGADVEDGVDGKSADVTTREPERAARRCPVQDDRRPGVGEIDDPHAVESAGHAGEEARLGPVDPRAFGVGGEAARVLEEELDVERLVGAGVATVQIDRGDRRRSTRVRDVVDGQAPGTVGDDEPRPLQRDVSRVRTGQGAGAGRVVGLRDVEDGDAAGAVGDVEVIALREQLARLQESECESPEEPR